MRRRFALSMAAAIGLCLAVPVTATAAVTPPAGEAVEVVAVQDEAAAPETVSDSEEDLPPLLPSGSSLSGEQDTSGGIGPRAVGGIVASPAGCVGITDYPHSSNGKVGTKNGPYASVHGRTKCNTNVTTVTARAEVWKKVWHGNQRLETGTLASVSNFRNSGDSTPHYYCKGTGKAWYVGITNHSSLEGGKWYTARTIEYGTQAMSEFTC